MGIEIGRENRADFKLIAKSLARIGNTYRKMENYKQAKFYYEKAMSEHRTPEIKTSLSEVEAKIKEEERRAYIDPSKAEEEKEKGNEYFKRVTTATLLNIILRPLSAIPMIPNCTAIALLATQS